MSKLQQLSVCAALPPCLNSTSPRGLPRRGNQWDAALIAAFGTWMGSFSPYGHSQSGVCSEMLRTGAGLSFGVLWGLFGVQQSSAEHPGLEEAAKICVRDGVGRAPAVPLPFSGALRHRFGFPFQKLTAKVSL